MAKGIAPFSVNRDGYHIAWDTRPAWVCTQCGEPYFEAEQITHIQSTLNQVDFESGNLSPAIRAPGTYNPFPAPYFFAGKIVELSPRRVIAYRRCYITTSLTPSLFKVGSSGNRTLWWVRCHFMLSIRRSRMKVYDHKSKSYSHVSNRPRKAMLSP